MPELLEDVVLACQHAPPIVGDIPGMPLKTAIDSLERDYSAAALVATEARPPKPREGARGWLAGTQLNGRVVAQLWIDAVEKLADENFFPTSDVARKAAGLDTICRAVAVASSESQRYTKAQNENYVNGVVDSVDKGMWQHNSKFGVHDPKTGEALTEEQCFDPAIATYFAVRVWAPYGDFRKWFGFLKGVYLFDAYWRVACGAMCNLMSVKLDKERVANGYTTGVYMPQLVDIRRVRLKPDGKELGYRDNH